MVESHNQITFPFSAIIAQDDFKLTLILNLVDPLIGGVLAIGDKGTGKTTLIRSLVNLMGEEEKSPFVNLPIGVSEDRLLGNVDLEQLINDKKEVINPGLMAQAHQGVLYVDEVNLLQDYLTDILLDAAASGRYHLEREGISHSFKSRFCLVGSMNPEEGNLRPQLKDRFGLSVNIKTPSDVNIRQSIIKQRLKFDDNPSQFIASYKEQDLKIVAKIEGAKNNLKSIAIDDAIIEYCSELAIQHQVEGVRADILLVKTARAFAAYQNILNVTKETVDAIAHFVLNHRKEQTPPNQQNQSQNQVNKPQDDSSEKNLSNEDNVQIRTPENTFQKQKQAKANTLQQGINTYSSKEGTILVTDTKKTVSQYVTTNKFELKSKRKNKHLNQHYIFLIDSSGSMLKDQIIAYAKGAVNKIAENSKNQNTQYSIVSLFNGEAQLIVNQTSILQDLETALLTLKTGGKTNLKAGFKHVKSICADINYHHNLHIITDGKLNAGDNLDDTVLAFQTFCKGVNNTQIIDAEKGFVKIGEAFELSNRINANYEVLMTNNL